VKFDENKNVLWKSPIPGRGHSSPTVVGERIFLATADETEQIQSVLCYNRDSGDKLWKRDIHQRGFPSARDMHPENSHASCTVACDGDRLFVAFLNNGAIWATAFDVYGKQIWQQNLGPFSPQFGYAPSPVIYGDLVIVAGDNPSSGFLAAVHRKSGKIVWRVQRPAEATYSSPVVFHVAGRDQLLISGCHRVFSYDPNTGEELWSVKGTASGTCGTMIAGEDVVFASGGWPEAETLCVRADGSKEVLWRTEQKAYVPSMLLHQEHLYLVDGETGIGFCLDAATGKQKWQTRFGGKVRSSPVLSDEHIFLPNAAGKFFVFQANAAAFELVAENVFGEAETAEIYATPVICGGRMYLRVAGGTGRLRRETLYCIGSGADDGTSADSARIQPYSGERR
jgi:hypothetical protein